MYINPKLLIYPFLLSSHQFVFCVCESISVFYINSFVSFFKSPHTSDIICLPLSELFHLV